MINLNRAFKYCIRTKLPIVVPKEIEKYEIYRNIKEKYDKYNNNLKYESNIEQEEIDYLTEMSIKHALKYKRGK